MQEQVKIFNTKLSLYEDDETQKLEDSVNEWLIEKGTSIRVLERKFVISSGEVGGNNMFAVMICIHYCTTS